MGETRKRDGDREGKLNGVTETRITKEETEVMNEVTELAETRRETQELKVLPETWEID